MMYVIAPALLIAGGIVALAQVSTASSAPAAVAALDSEEQEFLGLLNEYRAGLGLPTLSVDPQLEEASRWMSTDMATNDYFSHYDSLGRDPFERMDHFGYTYNVWKGENLAAGTSEAQVAFDLWRTSPGHNSNMTNALFHGIGIARAYGANSGLGWYWTTDFGGIANGEPPAEPTPSPTPSHSPTPTPTPTPSPTQTPTITPAPMPSPTATPGPHSDSPTPAQTPPATPGPTPTPTRTPGPGVKGDLDCNTEIDSIDALAILRLVAGLDFGNCAADTDIDCDGDTATTDARPILQYVADIRSGFGSGCPSVGAFLN
jgi:uncharacterized protein YkwD